MGWIWKNLIYKSFFFYPAFKLKFQVSHFLSTFQAVSRPEKVNDKIPGFPGRVGTRDVYRIESIILYRYHKTDTGIVSKWQINDTFNDTFMMILIRIELVWHKNEWFFLLNACFVFHFYIIWKIMVPEGQKEKAQRKKGIFLMVWYRILSVSFCQYQYCIVS